MTEVWGSSGLEDNGRRWDSLVLIEILKGGLEHIKFVCVPWQDPWVKVWWG